MVCIEVSPRRGLFSESVCPLGLEVLVFTPGIAKIQIRFLRGRLPLDCSIREGLQMQLDENYFGKSLK